MRVNNKQNIFENMQTRIEELTWLIDDAEEKLYRLTNSDAIWNLVNELVKLNIEKHDLLK